MGVSYWGWYPQKMVVKPDGTIEAYAAARDIAHFTGKYVVMDKWKDPEGNSLYRITTTWGDKTYGQTTIYELHRVRKTEPTRKYITSLDDFPAEIDPDHPEYHMYYRLEE